MKNQNSEFLAEEWEDYTNKMVKVTLPKSKRQKSPGNLINTDSQNTKYTILASSLPFFPPISYL